MRAGRMVPEPAKVKADKSKVRAAEAHWQRRKRKCRPCAEETQTKNPYERGAAVDGQRLRADSCQL